MNGILTGARPYNLEAMQPLVAARLTVLLVGAMILLPGCGGSRKRTQYVRVVEPTGRAYYAETSYAMYSEAGGFVTFRDLVTRDTVKLTNGRYSATPCSEDEVAAAQTKWLQDPKKPLESEYDPENGMSPDVWR